LYPYRTEMFYRPAFQKTEDTDEWPSSHEEQPGPLSEYISEK